MIDYEHDYEHEHEHEHEGGSVSAAMVSMAVNSS